MLRMKPLLRSTIESMSRMLPLLLHVQGCTRMDRAR